MEIDENLVRADLSPAERAAHQAERKKLYEAEFPETRHVTKRGGPGRGNKTKDKKPRVSYTAEAANKTGVNQRTVQREVARGAIPNVIAEDPSADLTAALPAAAKPKHLKRRGWAIPISPISAARSGRGSSSQSGARSAEERCAR